MIPEAHTEALTYGQKMAGVQFNPGGSPDVSNIKVLTAALIDEVYNQSQRIENVDNEEKKEFYRTAISELVKGQMLTVKACTWN